VDVFLVHPKKIMIRNIFARAFLIFTLLFVQQGAFSHALSHLSDAPASQTGQDKKLPHNGQCTKCAEYAQIASGIPSHFTPLIIQQVEVGHTIILPSAFTSRSFFPYSSRAPPVLA
jgi:hypothetical protein